MMEVTETAGVPPPPPRPERERRLSPVLALVAVVALVAFGGYAVAGALSRPEGPPVAVASVVRVRPLSGWELAGRSDDPPGVRLTRGSGNLDVVAVAFSGSDLALLDRYVAEVLEPDAEQLSVSRSVERVQLGSGLGAVRIAYVGLFGDVQAPIEGEVTALVSPSGVGVVFDGWTPTGLLRFARSDIEAMIDEAEVA